MLSVKLSQQLVPKLINIKQNNEISLEPIGVVMTFHTDSQSWEPHRELIETLGIKNNFISYKHVCYFIIYLSFLILSSLII